MNTSYNIASPTNSTNGQPAQPGGTAALQSALNSIQTQLVGYNPVTGKYGAPPAWQPTAVYSPASNSYANSTPGNPSWNGQQWVSSTTGQPYSGSYFGQNYVNGQTYQQMQNNPSQAYTPITIPKSPAIAGAASSLTNAFNNGLSLQNNDFSDFLSAANNATNAATTGFNNDMNTAYNLGPLSSTLGGLNAGYANNANALNTGFAGTAGQLNTNYSNVLSNLGNQENSAVSQAYGMLPQYDQALTDIGQQEQNALTEQISKYAAAGGTPQGLGSNEEQTLALGIGQAEVPLEEAKIGQNYNILQNMQVPLEQQQAAGQIGQLQNFTLPLANTIYGQGMNTLNTEYGQQYNTATGLQNLAIQIAGKPISEAVQYMQAMGVPAQVQQAILSGNVSNLAGLSNIWQGANYQGLQNNFGNSVSPVQGSSFVSPGYGGGNTNYGLNMPSSTLPTPGQMGIGNLNTQYGPTYTPTVGYGSYLDNAASMDFGVSPDEMAQWAAQLGMTPDQFLNSTAPS